MVTADTRRLHLLGELRHSAKSSMLAISSSKNTGVILVEIRSAWAQLARDSSVKRLTLS